MNTSRNGLLVIGLAVGIAVPAMATPPPGVYTLEPPRELANALIQLRDGTDDRAAFRALTASDIAAPYLRWEARVATDPRVRRVLNAAIKTIEDRAYERNLARARWWADTRRVDLATDFLSDCRTEDVTKLGDRLGEQVKAIADGTAGTPNRIPLLASKYHGYPIHLAGEEVAVPEKSPVRPVFLRAGTGTIRTWERWRYFAVVQGPLLDPWTPTKTRLGNRGKWENSVILVNGDMPLSKCEDSIVICAGDVTVRDWVTSSVVIAGGTIRTEYTKGTDQNPIYENPIVQKSWL